MATWGWGVHRGIVGASLWWGFISRALFKRCRKTALGSCKVLYSAAGRGAWPPPQQGQGQGQGQGYAVHGGGDDVGEDHAPLTRHTCGCGNNSGRWLLLQGRACTLPRMCVEERTSHAVRVARAARRRWRGAERSHNRSVTRVGLQNTAHTQKHTNVVTAALAAGCAHTGTRVQLPRWFPGLATTRRTCLRASVPGASVPP